METLEADRVMRNARVAELEGQIEASRKTRPTADFVCTQWKRLMVLWDAGAEEERMEIMQGLCDGWNWTKKKRDLRIGCYAAGPI